MTVVASWKRKIGEALDAVICTPIWRNISWVAEFWFIGTIVLAMKVEIMSMKIRKNIQTDIVASADVETRFRNVEKSIARPSQKAP